MGTHVETMLGNAQSVLNDTDPNDAGQVAESIDSAVLAIQSVLDLFDSNPEQDPEHWEVFLIDEDGFTQRDHDRAVDILAMIDDIPAIRRKYGDAVPDEITVARRDAKPVPQHEGSDILRQPSSRRVIDFIDFDLRDESDPEVAQNFWVGAVGVAVTLNAEAERIASGAPAAESFAGAGEGID